MAEDGPSELLERIRAAVSAAVIPLQCGGTVYQDRFSELVLATEAAVRSLKGQRMLDRELLKEIHFAERVLRRESEHLVGGPAQVVIATVDRLDLLFDLLLLGESPDDRRPGVPRII